jgi:hypothetical protein
MKETIMITSYGETSGFVPVNGEELTTVNGGISGCYDPFGQMWLDLMKILIPKTK